MRNVFAPLGLAVVLCPAIAACAAVLSLPDNPADASDAGSDGQPSDGAPATLQDGRDDATPEASNGQGDSKSDANQPPRGTIDPSFGDQGWAVVRFDSDAASPATLPSGLAVVPPGNGVNSGKIIALGSPLTGGPPGIVVRLTADGQPDLTFGHDGRALIQPPTSVLGVHGPVIDSQGRVLVGLDCAAPGAQCLAGVARLLPDGTMDAKFGNGGIAILSKSTAAIVQRSAYGIAVLPGDDVAVSGYLYEAATGTARAGLTKLRGSDGLPDPTFAGGQNPMALPIATAPGKVHSFAGAVAADITGRMVVAGAGQCSSKNVMWSECEPFVARVTSSGALDATFGAMTNPPARSGVTFPLSNSGRFDAMAFDPQGRIVAIGSGLVAGDARWLATRLNPTTGEWDSTFGTAGGVVFDAASGKTSLDQHANGLVFDANGAPTFAGSLLLPSKEVFAVVGKLDPSGEPDPAFGKGGAVSFLAERGIGWLNGVFVALARAPNGELLLESHSSRAQDGENMAIVRLTP